MFPNLSNFLVLVALFGCWPDQVACRDDGMPLEPQQFVQEILRMAREGQLNGFLEMLQIQPSGNQVPSADNTGNQTINSRFFLYNNSRNLLNRKEIVVGDADSLNQSGFNASRPTKILLHPWMGIPIIPPLLFPFSAKNAYLTLFRDAYNVVIMDYTRTTGYPIYPIAATRGFEEAMNDGTQFLTWLHNERMIDLNQTHIIGLSLGAHIGSAIAKQVNETTGVAVGRTTGLDPAGPLFFPKLPVLTPPHVMNASDARYVDVGHTNAFLAGLGIMQNVGQADFYLNGGINQPPCQSLNSVEASGIPGVGVALATICSHLIAGEYYSYSILRARFGRSRPRCACSNIVLFYGNPLCCDQRVIFGENSQRGTSGVLYMNYDFVRS